MVRYCPKQTFVSASRASVTCHKPTFPFAGGHERRERMDAGEFSSVQHDPTRGDFPHFGPRLGSRVKGLAKSSLALVECFRMVLQGLTAWCYAAGLHCP